MPIPFLSKEKIRKIIRTGYGSEQRWQVYTGATQNSLTLVTDADGLPSYIDTATPRKIQELALSEAFEITGETYVLTVAADSPPDANQTYWLSTDGQTFQMVEHVSRKTCHQGAYSRIVLQKR